MTDVSKGKNVQSLYIPKEDMIEHMKIISEAVRILVRVVEVSLAISPLLPAKDQLRHPLVPRLLHGVVGILREVRRFVHHDGCVNVAIAMCEAGLQM